MKKVLSVFLALIMVFSCIGIISVSAADATKKCTCLDCKKEDGCHCCIYCEYLDANYVLKCVNVDEDGNYVFCCDECTGIFPCKCGSKFHEYIDEETQEKVTHPLCCMNNYEEIDMGEGTPIFTPDQQDQIVTGFRNVLKTISDIFNRLFDAVYEWLRIGELFPDLAK